MVVLLATMTPILVRAARPRDRPDIALGGHLVRSDALTVLDPRPVVRASTSAATPPDAKTAHDRLSRRRADLAPRTGPAASARYAGSCRSWSGPISPDHPPHHYRCPGTLVPTPRPATHRGGTTARPTGVIMKDPASCYRKSNTSKHVHANKSRVDNGWETQSKHWRSPAVTGTPGRE